MDESAGDGDVIARGPPTVFLRVADLGSVPLPTELPATVEHVMDRSLVRRPDLAARLAALRAREAEVKQARAQFMPQLRVSSSAGGDFGRYTFGNSDSINFQQQAYGAFLNLNWTLFDGFDRENRVREAAAQRGAAEAEVAALELRVIRQVWQAYTDVKTSLGKREFGRPRRKPTRRLSSPTSPRGWPRCSTCSPPSAISRGPASPKSRAAPTSCARAPRWSTPPATEAPALRLWMRRRRAPGYRGW